MSAQGTSFRKVTRSFNAASGARRKSSKMTVSRTGAVRSNTDGKELSQEFVRAGGGDPENFQVVVGGNEEKGQLALYLPQPGDAGLMKVAVYENSIAFHVGAAFAEYPKLRPVTTVDCAVESTVDADGIPCLVIQIHGATPTRTVKRKNKGEAEATQPAAGNKKE